VIRLDESRPHCGGLSAPAGVYFVAVIRLDESRPHCGFGADREVVGDPDV